MRSEPEPLKQADFRHRAELPLMTSNSDPIRVDFLTDIVELLPGQLGMTIAPGKCNLGMQAVWQRQLEPDLQRLCQYYHTDLLVTLLQAHELSDLQIPALFDQVQDYGMQSCWFPIRDFGTPNSMAGLQQLVEQLLTVLADGQTIVVHCKGGLGRSGLVTASCLVALGYSPEAAFRLVRKARPGSVKPWHRRHMWPSLASFGNQFSASCQRPFPAQAAPRWPAGQADERTETLGLARISAA